MASRISTIWNKLGKKRIAALSVAGALVLAGCSSSAPNENSADGAGSGEETYKLTYASALSDTHPSSQATSAWIERISELTDGRVEINPIWGGALLPSGEILAGVASGRADIGQTSAPWNMSELPYTSISTLPFLTYDGEASIRALNELYASNEDFHAEYDNQGLHFITFQPLDSVLLGSKTGYGNIDALEGAELRAVGKWSEVLSDVGAVPSGIAYAEIYESVQRGVIEGYGLNWEGIFDVKLHEVAPIMEDPGLGSISNMELIMNQELWNSFPSDIQDAFNQATIEQVDMISDLYADITAGQCQVMVDQGAEFKTWDQDDVDAWVEISADTVLSDWIASVPDAEKGQTVLDEYRSLMDEHADASKWQSGLDICASLG